MPPTLPPGYHLIYYPLQVPPHLLFPDGTDADHCPGTPFTRRMWAGGRIEFGKSATEKFRVDGRKTVCVETIGRDQQPPTMQVGNDGKEQEQRVWVDVWRRYEAFAPGEETTATTTEQQQPSKTSTEKGEEQEEGIISELRRLVFLRERDPPSSQKLEPPPARTIKVPHSPDFAFTLTPDATLLFQFSALTFNAHAIHLDPLYAREVEGYKERLVHGPLTLVIMLSAAQGFVRGATTGGGADVTKFAAADAHPETQISDAIKERLSVPDEVSTGDTSEKRWEIASIDYKNLRPLFVGEEMKVCIRLLPNREKKRGDDEVGLDRGHRERVDVWIEAPDGGLAVKGTVGIEWR